MTLRSDSINVSLLSQPITKEEIQKYAPKSQWFQLSTKWLYIAVIAFLVIGMGSNFGSLQSYRSINSVWIYIVIALCLVGAIIAASISSKRIAKRQALLNRFAAQHNIIVRNNTSPAGQTGMIFQYGHSQKINQILLFPDGLEIGNYQYTTGSGRNSRTHTWSFASVPLNRSMPHIVLDSTSNNLFRRFSNLPEGFDADQKLSLEGDFGNYFTLYAPQEYKKDLFYLFTPDVMAALIDHGKNYDIEIIDSTLYFYTTTHTALHIEEKLRSILTMTEIISDEIIDQNQNYRDERLVGESPVIQQSAIAYQGRRLKRSVDLVAVVTWLALIGFFIYSVTRG